MADSYDRDHGRGRRGKRGRRRVSMQGIRYYRSLNFDIFQNVTAVTLCKLDSICILNLF